MQELWLKVQYTVYPQLLFDAAREKDPTQLNNLLEHKNQLNLDLNRPNPSHSYDTPISGAWFWGRYENVLTLLEAGANPNILNAENCSLVVDAICIRLLGLFRLLLWYNVNFDVLNKISKYSTTVDILLNMWTDGNLYGYKLPVKEIIKQTLKNVQEVRNQEDEAEKALKAAKSNQSAFANYLRAINAYIRIAKIFYHESEIEIEVQARKKFDDYSIDKALQPILIQHYQKKALHYYLKAHECFQQIKITALSQIDREYYTTLQEIIGRLAATLDDTSLSNTHYELAAKHYSLLAKEAYMADKKEEAGKCREKAVSLYQNLLAQPTSSQKGQFYHLQLQTLQQIPILCKTNTHEATDITPHDSVMNFNKNKCEPIPISTLIHRLKHKETTSNEDREQLLQQNDPSFTFRSTS